MENATDALKIAFAAFVFIMALTIAITMFSQLNQVSKIVVSSSDNTKYYEYKATTDDEKTRIVGLESIIPTLYKYYKENYTVLFLEANGEPMNLYKTKMEDTSLWSDYNQELKVVGKYYKNNNNNNPICSFDVEEETARHEPWTGNLDDYNENLDAFLSGGTFTYKDDKTKKYEYKRGFVEKYYNKKFKETLGEYTYNLSTEVKDNENSLLKNRKKRVIVYQLQE